jgi:tetratricopeptide (TPR) repeat protein
LDLQPNDASALLNLGAVLARSGRNIAAVKCYDRLLALDPSATAARFNRGDLLVGLGQLADAEQDFRAVLKSAPDNLDAAARLHQVLAMGHRWTDLLALWRNVGKATPESLEVACYAEWAKVLRAFDRHEPLPASASGMLNDDACAAWIAVYARFRERDFTGLAAALDRLPDTRAAAAQAERRRRVVMGAFEALPVELRNSRPGLFIAARLSAYLRDSPNAMRFADVLAQGDDEWAARAKALRSQLDAVGAEP